MLNLKNKELIDDLNNEVMHRTRTQVLLEESKRHLEDKVKERTIELEIINDNLTTIRIQGCFHYSMKGRLTFNQLKFTKARLSIWHNHHNM